MLARNFEDYQSFAIQTAVEAGRDTLSRFRQKIPIENKAGPGSFDPVTDADRDAETIIRGRIAEAYPEHGILGEEFGHQEGNGLTWVIDPIDGTRAFMTGMLHWGVLLALYDGTNPIVGVMYQPFTEEIYTGCNGAAEYRRGDEVRELRVRECTGLDDAVLACTGPEIWAESGQAEFDRLTKLVKLTRYGGDCYLYCMLAMGFIDLAVEALNSYDIQALIPIIEGAGGIITTVDGGNASQGGIVVAAGDKRVHAQALEIMNS